MVIGLKAKLKIKELSDNVYILLDPSEGSYLKVNKTGKEVIDFLYEKRKDVKEIIEAIRLKYNIPYELIEDDIKSYINILLEKGFAFDDQLSGSKIKKHEENSQGLKNIWIKVTNKCNLKCPYCYADSKKEENNNFELTIIEIEKIFEEVSQMGLEKIVITGGEPLLRKDIVDILKIAKKYAQVQLLTNGTVFNEEVLNEVVKYVDIIQFSIDSPNDIEHNAIRGKDTFSKTLNTVKYIRELGFKNIVFATTPTPSNNVDLERMVDFSIENGARRLHVNRYVPLGRANNDDYAKFNIEEFYRRADDAYTYVSGLYGTAIKDKKSLDFSIDISGDFVNSVYSIGKKYSCGLNKSIMSVDSNGDIYLCQAIHSDKLKIGNIREKNMKSILENSNTCYGCFSVDNLNKCNECDVKYWCGGGCRALAYAVNKDIFAQDPHCGSNKKRILDLMGRI